MTSDGEWRFAHRFTSTNGLSVIIRTRYPDRVSAQDAADRLNIKLGREAYTVENTKEPVA